MIKADPSVIEETLDPTDWQAHKAAGHDLVEALFDYLATVRDRPCWTPIPPEIKNRCSAPAPLGPQPLDQVIREASEVALDHPLGNLHPRFWGWVIGTGTPSGVLAEMLVGTINANAFGADQAATYLEHQVLGWFKEMFAMPKTASGLLVSGCSMANLVGIVIARNARCGFDIKQQGIYGDGRRLTLYGSSETHSSVQKAAELIGIGNEGYRRVAVNEDFTIDLAALRAAITSDLDAGCRPFCVVANAGTVNTGAFDDLNGIADLCEEFGLWMHVDGAFGLVCALSPNLRSLTDGMERADSMAFDLHKWMHVTYDTACVLVRDEPAHHRAFQTAGAYLAPAGGLAAGPAWPSEYGIQLSRGYRALKAWMHFKEHGFDKIGRLAEQNCAQAAYLVELVQSEPDLELCAPAPLNIVCFRYAPKGADHPDLNALNRELLARLQESGIAAPSSTVLDGRFCIRVSIANHRTKIEDLRILTDAVLELGGKMLARL